jgi:hypothetical protein
METVDERLAREALRAAPAEQLLRTYAALTHRIHSVEAERGRGADEEGRAQRDLVQAEALRRMGGGRA